MIAIHLRSARLSPRFMLPSASSSRPAGWMSRSSWLTARFCCAIDRSMASTWTASSTMPNTPPRQPTSAQESDRISEQHPDMWGKLRYGRD